MRMRILAAIAATTLLYTPAAYGEGEKDRNYYRQLELFGDVFERVRADYVKEVSEEKLIQIAGMNYLQLKNFLGLDADFCIHFEDEDG